MTFTTRCKQLCRRLRADAIKGSAAIEFAMVAPVFFMLLMGTIEAGVMFFAQSALQNALNDTARLVRTGQTGCYTTSGGNCVAMTQAQFRTQLCSEVSTLLQNCSGAQPAIRRQGLSQRLFQRQQFLAAGRRRQSSHPHHLQCRQCL